MATDQLAAAQLHRTTTNAVFVFIEQKPTKPDKENRTAKTTIDILCVAVEAARDQIARPASTRIGEQHDACTTSPEVARLVWHKPRCALQAYVSLH